MIRPLRRVHKLAFMALAVALPVLLVLALRARIPDPRVSRLPAAPTVDTGVAR